MERELIEAIVQTENLFPQTFADMVERDWGVLFVTPSAPDSHDGNHACVTKHYDDVTSVVDEIVEFYESRGVIPRVNHVSADDGHSELREALRLAGFTIGIENTMEKVYLCQAPSRITPNPDVRVQYIESVDADMFEALVAIHNLRMATVIQRRACRADDWLFVGKFNGELASVALLERLGNICRVDEVHTAECHRRKGCSRAVIHAMVAHYKEMCISAPLYLWVENPVAERIYVEAGFVKQQHSLVNWSAWKEA